MGLESATYINQLVSTNPTGGDSRAEGDDHLRLLKSVLKATFPNLSAAVTSTAIELNYIAGVTSAVQSQLNAKQSLDSILTALTGLNSTPGLLEQIGAAAFTKRLIGVANVTDIPTRGDADTRYVRGDATQSLSKGYSGTPYNAGTFSAAGTYTPNEANGNIQYAINGGAHTLAPPTNNTSIVIQYTNNATAGVITTSGFTRVTGSFTTTNGDDFMCYVTKVNGFSHLHIQALQ